MDISRTIRNTLAFYSVLNVLALVALPSYTIQWDYDGLMGWRLHGLANHANSLAPYMLLLIATLVLRPFRRPQITVTSSVLALGLLLATQSKTTIIMFIVLVLFTLPRLTGFLGAQMRLGLTLALVPIIIAGLGFALTASGSLDALLSNEDVTSFTNRDMVWQATLGAWRLDPLMGYGSSALWNDDMGSAFAVQYGWQPKYAHNLWLQVLGQAGLLGVVTLVGLLLYLVARVRNNEEYGTLLLGLVVVFFGMRGVSEVPIGTSLLTDNTVIQLMVMLIIVRSAARRPH